MVCEVVTRQKGEDGAKRKRDERGIKDKRKKTSALDAGFFFLFPVGA